MAKDYVDQAAYRAANREKRRAQNEAWRKAHPDYSKQASLAWRTKNIEKAKATRKIYQAEHAFQIKLKDRLYREANREKQQIQSRAWWQANRDRIAVYGGRRRRAIEQGDLTPAQWVQILEEFEYRCAYCNEAGPLELEHMTPLSRGGRHTASNVVPSCTTCNRGPGGKFQLTALEFAGGRYAFT